MPAVSAVVDDFAGNVLADTRINKKFAKSNAPRCWPTSKISSASPPAACKYTGLSMKESHKNMGTTAGEFNALVEDLVKTLNKFGVKEQEQKELLTALAGLKGDIVENESAKPAGRCPRTSNPPAAGAPATAAAALLLLKQAENRFALRATRRHAGDLGRGR